MRGSLIILAGAAVAALVLPAGKAPAAAQAPQANPLCLSLPNGAPQFVTGQGAGNALNTAHNNARSDWSRQAGYNNRPGQAGYDNWNNAARTNISSSSHRTGFITTWTVVYVGQPCRPQ